VIWGLDVARYGDDRSALAKRQGERLLEVKAWQGVDLMETAGRVYNEYQLCNFKTRPAAIYVDSIGLGSGVLDRLRELGLPVRGVNVSESPAVGERYLRLRDELWFRVREWLEARLCQLPRDEELAAELGGPRFRILSSGKLKVDSKDEIKKRGARSPDKAGQPRLRRLRRLARRGSRAGNAARRRVRRRNPAARDRAGAGTLAALRPDAGDGLAQGKGLAPIPGSARLGRGRTTGVAIPPLTSLPVIEAPSGALFSSALSPTPCVVTNLAEGLVTGITLSDQCCHQRHQRHQRV
jgi:hypothetical protein